jgi:hypothetical protein
MENGNNFFFVATAIKKIGSTPILVRRMRWHYMNFTKGMVAFVWHHWVICRIRRHHMDFT